MSDYPAPPVPVNHVEPVPRRIRAFLAGQAVVDTTDARYVWENTVLSRSSTSRSPTSSADALVDEGTTEETSRGDARRYGLRVGDVDRPSAATVLTAAKVEGLDDTVRFAWSAFDAWFEEDEQVFVHPRNPYTRVDSLRSSRHAARRVQGRRPGRVLVAGPVLRDRAADPLLPRPDRRRLHPPGAVRHRDRVPLQGRRRAATGRPWSTGAPIRTSPGPTTSRPATCCRSPG